MTAQAQARKSNIADLDEIRVAAPLPIAGLKVGFALAEIFLSAKSGGAYPSYSAIAQKTGLTERGVRAGVAALVRQQFLRVKKRGFSQSNLFKLQLPKAIHSVTAMPDCGEDIPSPVCPSIRHGHDDQSVTAVTANLPTKSSQIEPSYKAKVLTDEEVHQLDRPLPTGHIQRCREDRKAEILITSSACRWLGYTLEDSRCGDGRYADEMVRQELPAVVLDSLKAKCAAGTLSEREVAVAVIAAGIYGRHAKPIGAGSEDGA
jgi:hypothetical protein